MGAVGAQSMTSLWRASNFRIDGISLVARVISLLYFRLLVIIMDDPQHPLVATPPPPATIGSPAPNAGDDIHSKLRSHADFASSAATRYEQQPIADSKTFRGRSKSLASYGWTVMPPRLPMDYIIGGGSFPGHLDSAEGFNTTESAVHAGVPYKARSWEPTLERAIKAIVSIKASHVRSFDTETSGGYTATGFIVDAQRGIILTNRHVVSPAPIVAQAILTNYEEVDLKPVYRDPVHDFGFMKVCYLFLGRSETHFRIDT